jgi:quercetin dioxygenase-like cupin family protein
MQKLATEDRAHTPSTAPTPSKPLVDVILREVLETLPNGARQELRVILGTLPPGARTPRHSHRFPVTVFVQEGAFTLELEGCEPITVTAGQTLIEPPHIKMVGSNRASEPLKLVMFYVSDPDTPFADVAQ